MLDFIYSWFGYRNLKTGLLCDFYIKRVAKKFIQGLYFHFAWFFGDKFLIEYCSTRLYVFIIHKLSFLSTFYMMSYRRLFSLALIFITLVFITLILHM